MYSTKLQCLTLLIFAACGDTGNSSDFLSGDGKADSANELGLADSYVALIDSSISVCKLDRDDKDGDGDSAECRPGSSRKALNTNTIAVASVDAGQLKVQLCSVDIQEYDDLALKISSSGLQKVSAISEASVSAADDGIQMLSTSPTTMVFGAKLDNPSIDSLPTRESDSRVKDHDRDGEAGISLDAKKDGYNVSVYTALRVTLSIDGEIHDDLTVTGNAHVAMEMTVLGDSSWLFDGQGEWGDLQNERRIADQQHTLTMFPLDGSVDCDLALAILDGTL